MNKDNFSYKIVEHIATLSESAGYTKELNLVSYRDGKPKYDLRGWKRTDGQEQLLKGITLTDTEAKQLKEALAGRTEL